MRITAIIIDLLLINFLPYQKCKLKPYAVDTKYEYLQFENQEQLGQFVYVFVLLYFGTKH